MKQKQHHSIDLDSRPFNSIALVLFCLLYTDFFHRITFNMSTALLADEQKKMFTVKLEEVQNGRIDIHPPLPFNGKVEVGTEFTVKATADVDHIIDSVYASFKHKKWNIKYDESMSDSLKVIIDRDKTIGASFIHGIEMKDLHVIQNIVYAQPGVKALKYDVFAPKGAKNLPCVIIVHGGGWSTNNEDIMRGLGRELARSGKYVAFSIDYRLIRFSDGDQMPNSIVDLIEDVFGAIAHIQEHAVNYGADPTRIAMTGDSAGGHLSASVANMASMIGDRGFGKTQGVFEYKPTYLPNNKSIEEVRHNIASAIQATAPSYGIFGGKILANLGRDLPEGGIQAISPISTIPDPKTRRVAHYLLRGTKDWIKHESIQVYADALQAAGQHVIYEQIPNARHAFLDWKPNDKVKSTFRKYGLPCAKKMVDFFDSVFTP